MIGYALSFYVIVNMTPIKMESTPVFSNLKDCRTIGEKLKSKNEDLIIGKYICTRVSKIDK